MLFYEVVCCFNEILGQTQKFQSADKMPHCSCSCGCSCVMINYIIHLYKDMNLTNISKKKVIPL